MNAALAALASQYPTGPFGLNPSALAAMAQMHHSTGGTPNVPMQNLMTNLLSGIMNKDQVAGNCYNLE